MNKFTRLLALLLVAAAIVLVVIAFSIGRKQPATAPATATRSAAPAERPAASTYPVVVAAADLAFGEPIAAASLKIEKRQRAVDEGYTRVADAVGQVPVQPIAAGTTLTRGLLINGLSLRLEPGERALAVSVDEAVGVGNRIEPGDFVDVFFSLEDKAGMGAERDTQARLLLPRLRVLAYGAGDLPAPTDAPPAPPVAVAATNEKTRDDDKASDAAKKAASEAAQRAERKAQARTAVLAVPVEQVNRLLLAAQNGKLALALRNPTDTELPDPTLFPQPGPVLEAKPGLTAVAAADATAKLDTPDNRAYAGIALSGLAGDAKRTKPVRTQRNSAPRSQGIEVIRGTERGTLSVPASSRPESTR